MMKKQTHLYFCMPRWAYRLDLLFSFLSVLLILISVCTQSSTDRRDRARFTINDGIILTMSAVVAMSGMKSVIDPKRVSRVEPEDGGL